MDCHPQLPEFNLRGFIDQFTKILPNILRLLNAIEIEFHPIWGRLLPFDVYPYGKRKSPGHCIRADIVLTTEGVKVCELDFVSSGRGILLASLPEQDKKIFAQAFCEWYRKILPGGKYFYATATKLLSGDMEAKETQFFCDEVRKNGTDIAAINIDDPSLQIENSIIDRLFYRSEMTNHNRVIPDNCAFMTAEPWLDSKMFSALIHDEESTGYLSVLFSRKILRVLRRLIPYSRPVEFLRQGEKESMVLDHDRWILKNTDVETDTCWGSRGVMIGKRYTEPAFGKALIKSASSKDLGEHPIIQEYHQSIDFRDVWNGVVEGRYLLSPVEQFGKSYADEVYRPTTKHIHGRIGLYFLVNPVRFEVITPPYGIITLRENEMVHGSSDCQFVPFRVV